jgi:hypothetical protein
MFGNLSPARNGNLTVFVDLGSPLSGSVALVCGTLATVVPVLLWIGPTVLPCETLSRIRAYFAQVSTLAALIAVCIDPRTLALPAS